MLYLPGIQPKGGGRLQSLSTPRIPPRAREAGRYAAAFLLPAAVMLAVYALIGVAPFGEKSLLVTDMDGQYVSFFSYLKDMARNGNDFFYTFSKNLGGDMAGFVAYYLLSPFNLVLLPFSHRPSARRHPSAHPPQGGSAGLTCALFLSRAERAGSGTLLFSCSYALMGFVFVYQQNILWLDGIIFLPLVLWGVPAADEPPSSPPVYPQPGRLPDHQLLHSVYDMYLLRFVFSLPTGSDPSTIPPAARAGPCLSPAGGCWARIWPRRAWPPSSWCPPPFP